jgi:hypothetical protein
MLFRHTPSAVQQLRSTLCVWQIKCCDVCMVRNTRAARAAHTNVRARARAYNTKGRRRVTTIVLVPVLSKFVI